ncbi:MAG TPA: phosphoglucomutase/phosphomannomutase family protein [Candidatus Polarisedimenticolia bacterium]|jgi:phosphomannomutase
MTLKFGTDGWRAIIGEEFTFANVRRMASGIARAMREAGGATSGAAVVGYDTRFLSRRFAEAAAETFMGAGVRVTLADQPCPTPAASCQVVATGAGFAVVITASHNPAAYNGVKVKDRTGSSAGQELTAACESRIPAELPAALSLELGRSRGLLDEGSFREAHRDRLARMVDLDAIRRSGLKVVTDPMHGACGTILAELLKDGSATVATLHPEPDPLFGGLHPEPLEQNLEELRRAVTASGADVGFATDGDGDRIGAFDEKGQFISPLRIAPLLALSLLKKGRRGPLGKTFANTLLLDRIAKHHGLPFSVFPVGFKYIAGEMRAGRMLLGGEESGGIGVEGYIPERDGTLVSLMLLQAMVDEGKPLSEIVAHMTRQFGELHYRRRDLACAPEEGRRLVERLKVRPPATLGGMKVTGYDDLDGLKLLFGDEGWILFRASGTEPVLRVYSEAPTLDRLDAVMHEALSLFP